MLAPELVAPAFCTVPEHFTTLGDEVADLAAQVGFPPDPEQRMLLDMMYAAKRDRSWAAFEFCVICSRQNLKTGLFKMAAVADLFLFNDELVIWTAHLFDTTQGAFRDIKKLIDGSDLLSRRVKKITEGNGDEEIILTNGCSMQFLARSKAGGRGKTGSKVFLDEGFALQPVHIGSLYPTMATVAGAQIRIGSSAGMVASEVLRGLRDRGRVGDASLAYAEWSDTEPPVCADPMCDHRRDADGCCLDDRTRWQRSNPAMGRRITEERIADFRRSMPPEEFAREFLGWWDEASADGPINMVKWLALQDPHSAAMSVTAFGIDISVDRSVSAIAAAGPREDGKVHVESIDRRAGTGWLVKRCLELDANWHPSAFVIDEGGPAASLVKDFEDAGLTVLLTSTADVASASALFVDAVDQGTQHHGPQTELDDAVRGAKRRPFRDGGFAFGRRASGVDISPLVAATLATWGHDQLYAMSAGAYVL